MPHDFLLLLTLIAPLVLCTLLRINAGAVFLGLCLGLALTRYASNAVESFAGIFTARLSTVSASSLQLLLLLAPMALVAFGMLFSVRGKIKLLINLIPAAGLSVLVALSVVPLLASGLRNQIEDQALWPQIVRYQGLAAGVCVAIGLWTLWTSRRPKRASEKSRR